MQVLSSLIEQVGYCSQLPNQLYVMLSSFDQKGQYTRKILDPKAIKWTREIPVSLVAQHVVTCLKEPRVSEFLVWFL